MKRRWKQPSTAVAGMIVVWLVSVVIVTSGATASLETDLGEPVRQLAKVQGDAVQRPQTSEQVFKNIQILKGIPVDEFMGTMGLFSAALSMCCGDCHTGAGTSNPKWEDDP